MIEQSKGTIKFYLHAVFNYSLLSILFESMEQWFLTSRSKAFIAEVTMRHGQQLKLQCNSRSRPVVSNLFCFTTPFQYFLTYRNPPNTIFTEFILKKHKIYSLAYIFIHNQLFIFNVMVGLVSVQPTLKFLVAC